MNPEPPPHEPLDCGPDGWAVEDHGPPDNRVNYVILARRLRRDHHQHHARRRTSRGARSCASTTRRASPTAATASSSTSASMKVVSQSNGIGKGPTAFDGGNGGDRLGACQPVEGERVHRGEHPGQLRGRLERRRAEPGSLGEHRLAPDALVRRQQGRGRGGTARRRAWLPPARRRVLRARHWHELRHEHAAALAARSTPRSTRRPTA